MTEIRICPSPFPSPLRGEGGVRGVWVLDNWDLFGAWNLVIGISPKAIKNSNDE
jgi:hypothetical protein